MEDNRSTDHLQSTTVIILSSIKIIMKRIIITSAAYKALKKYFLLFSMETFCFLSFNTWYVPTSSMFLDTEPEKLQT